MKGVRKMITIVVAIDLFALMALSPRFAVLADRYMEEVYERCANEDKLKTNFAIYGVTYWVGYITWMCLAGIVELAGSPMTTADCIEAAVLTVAFAFCFNLTKIFYKKAKAKEEHLIRYLARNN